ncbi:hypothetical protein U9R62_06870 [Cylindrospermopsis raciborskii DSH]
MVYQEQIMKIAQDMAEQYFSRTSRFIRRAMGKSSCSRNANSRKIY